MIMSVIATGPLITNSGQEARSERIIFRLHETSHDGWNCLRRWWTHIDGRVYETDLGRTDFTIPNVSLALPTLYEVRRMAP